MNVTIEEINACSRRLRIEVPVNEVNETIDRITAEFQKDAKIPGFRPGKAPVAMVGKRYEKEIDEEVRRTLVPKTYRTAVKEKKLRVVTAPSLEEIKFERGLSLSFAALVDISPDFVLPEYKGIAVPATQHEVTAEEYEKAINGMRDRFADFLDVADRGIQAGDFAVISFDSTCDGKPLLETAPAAKNLAARKSFWLLIQDDAYLPSFGKQLLGLKPGDKKDVEVVFGDDFAHAELRGKKAIFAVDVEQLKEKKLPELNEEFAKKMNADSLDALHDQFRKMLNEHKKKEGDTEKGNKIVDYLLSKVNCEVPESLLQHYTRNMIQDIVEQNYSQGVAPEALESKRDEIFHQATHNARETVKIKFILTRIAEQENIEVTEEELNTRIEQLARRSGITPQKVVETLYEKNSFGALEDEILTTKTMAFLLKESKEESAP